MNNAVLVDKNGYVVGRLSDFSVLIVPDDVLSMSDPEVDGYAQSKSEESIPLIAVQDLSEAGSLPGLVFVGTL